MRAILKQTSWLFLAQALGRVFGLFYTIFLARILGVEEFGLYILALTYFSLLSSVSDFGFNRFLIRELAKDAHKLPQLICNIAMLRLVTASLLFAIFAIVIYFLDTDKLRVSLTLLAVLAILPQSIAITLDGVFVAFRKLQFSAVALLISSLTTVFLGSILVYFGLGAFGAVNALIFGQLAYVVSLAIFLWWQGGLHLTSVEFSTLKKVLIGSLPYGLLTILGLLYFRIDTVMLSFLRGNFEVGLYGAVYRFLEAVIFIPSAFFSALFPVLAKLHDTNTEDVKGLYFKSLKVMGILGVLVFALFLVIVPQIINIFLPNYLPSLSAIIILSLAIPFIYIHVPAVSVLLSTDKFLKPIIILSFLTLSFNVITNLIFIPRYGYISAAWITTFSEILSFVVFFWLVKIKILDAKG